MVFVGVPIVTELEQPVQNGIWGLAVFGVRDLGRMHPNKEIELRFLPLTLTLSPQGPPGERGQNIPEGLCC